MSAAAREAAAAIMVAERARHAAEVAALEERRRLALSLHDSVGAMLFALSASVRSLGVDLQRDPALLAKVESIERRAHDASVALRESLHALTVSPGELVLTVVLRADCRHFQERTGIPTRLIQMDDLPPSDTARADVLVAAVREGLLNVEKHAGARSVVVTAFASRGGIAVAVSDDGVGVAGAKSDGWGIGLQSLRDRAERLGGSVHVADGEDGGTTMRVWVPC
jgi:signal transduction histidine kinase